MIFEIIAILLLIISIICFIGFILNIIYLILIPSKELSTEDCLRKNILTKYLKIKK